MHSRKKGVDEDEAAAAAKLSSPTAKHPVLGINVEWRNLFSSLLNAEYNHELKVYLSCCPLYANQRRTKTTMCLADCQNDTDKALFAWSKIEKRVRVIVSNACVSSVEAR